MPAGPVVTTLGVDVQGDGSISSWSDGARTAKPGSSTPGSFPARPTSRWKAPGSTWTPIRKRGVTFPAARCCRSTWNASTPAITPTPRRPIARGARGAWRCSAAMAGPPILGRGEAIKYGKQGKRAAGVEAGRRRLYRRHLQRQGDLVRVPALDAGLCEGDRRGRDRRAEAGRALPLQPRHAGRMVRHGDRRGGRRQGSSTAIPKRVWQPMPGRRTTISTAGSTTWRPPKSCCSTR
jgi:hypothetical protein